MVGLASGPGWPFSGAPSRISATRGLGVGAFASWWAILATRSRRACSLRSRLRRIIFATARNTTKSATPAPRKPKYSVGTAPAILSIHDVDAQIARTPFRTAHHAQSAGTLVDFAVTSPVGRVTWLIRLVADAWLLKVGVRSRSSTKMNFVSHCVMYLTTFGPGMRFPLVLRFIRVPKAILTDISICMRRSEMSMHFAGAHFSWPHSLTQAARNALSDGTCRRL